MMTLNIDFDEYRLASTGLSKEKMKQDLKEALAAKLFELGRVTLSQATVIAGLPVWTFMEALFRLKVSVINLTPEQLANELAQC